MYSIDSFILNLERYVSVEHYIISSNVPAGTEWRAVHKNTIGSANRCCMFVHVFSAPPVARNKLEPFRSFSKLIGAFFKCEEGGRSIPMV